MDMECQSTWSVATLGYGHEYGVWIYLECGDTLHYKFHMDMVMVSMFAYYHCYIL